MKAISQQPYIYVLNSSTKRIDAMGLAETETDTDAAFWEEVEKYKNSFKNFCGQSLTFVDYNALAALWAASKVSADVKKTYRDLGESLSEDGATTVGPQVLSCSNLGKLKQALNDIAGSWNPFISSFGNKLKKCYESGLGNGTIYCKEEKCPLEPRAKSVPPSRPASGRPVL
jgi:hypothetical protein